MARTSWNTYTARDFTTLQFALHQNSMNEVDTAVILIHGITAELPHQEKFADALQMEADVYLPILRGYDQLNERGDLQYVGQYDDDLFDFVHFIKKKGYKKLLLTGHSMGAANILRLMKKNPDIADHYFFLSPFFHPNLPVYYDDATDQFKGETNVDYKVYEKRAMILMTLYKLKVPYLSHEKVAEIPDEFDESGRLDLSFRLMASRFLEEIPNDIFHGIEEKVHTFVGTDDEVIQPFELESWYENTFSLHLNIIRGTDHNHILHHPRLHERLAAEVKNNG
ncbi:alpha/beta fold hydrolase [Halobacillus yeomjeoni]|uniref:Alpha/beta hydrolase n=1 Tax=Halobacillus yeomjeoni TaxID=311194 RepID=A0A931HU84_9BACI|nr:alpha/beta hydrolase [Halobacillus yeomjeoni]MBH0229493.1 alpha/beta hydrolase [Halobacillus yeomjeoni]